MFFFTSNGSAQLGRLMNDNTLIDCYADSSVSIEQYFDDVPDPIRLTDGTIINRRGARRDRYF